MSFRVYITIPHEEIPPPSDPSKFDAWLEECNKFSLYDAPLGADGTVYDFWSSIARQLGLPLITSIYEHGLKIESTEELNRLEEELNALENYWKSHHLEDPDPKSAIRDFLEEHLQERMEYFRTAVKLAKEHRAILSVS